MLPHARQARLCVCVAAGAAALGAASAAGHPRLHPAFLREIERLLPTPLHRQRLRFSGGEPLPRPPGAAGAVQDLALLAGEHDENGVVPRRRGGMPGNRQGSSFRGPADRSVSSKGNPPGASALTGARRISAASGREWFRIFSPNFCRCRVALFESCRKVKVELGGSDWMTSCPRREVERVAMMNWSPLSSQFFLLPSAGRFSRLISARVHSRGRQPTAPFAGAFRGGKSRIAGPRIGSGVSGGGYFRTKMPK